MANDANDALSQAVTQISIPGLIVIGLMMAVFIGLPITSYLGSRQMKRRAKAEEQSQWTQM